MGTSVEDYKSRVRMHGRKIVHAANIYTDVAIDSAVTACGMPYALGKLKVSFSSLKNDVPPEVLPDGSDITCKICLSKLNLLKPLKVAQNDFKEEFAVRYALFNKLTGMYYKKGIVDFYGKGNFVESIFDAFIYVSKHSAILSGSFSTYKHEATKKKIPFYEYNNLSHKERSKYNHSYRFNSDVYTIVQVNLSAKVSEV